MKKKILALSLGLSAFLILFVASGFILYKTGKIKFGADMILYPETYTVSGTSTDPATNLPMVDQKITVSVAKEDGQQVETETDEHGKYQARIRANEGDLINIFQGEGDQEFDNCERIAGEISQPLSCDFFLGKIPFDLGWLDANFGYPSDNEANAGLVSKIKADDPTEGPLDRKIINDITFYTPKEGSSYYYVNLDEYSDQLNNVAEWLKTLKKSTGVDDAFPVIIVPRINWVGAADGSDAGAYMQWGKHPKMVLTQNSFLNLGSIAHEYGHYVDNKKSGEIVLKNRTSSDDLYFIEAFKELKRTKAVTGYGSSNAHEFFAEMFASIMVPDSSANIDLSKWSGQQRFRNLIDQYLLLKPFSSPPMDISSINSVDLPLDERIKIQNCLIYSYKHIASVSQQVEYYPGQVRFFKGNASPKDIVLNGGFMDGNGLLTIRFQDHFGVSLDGVDVSFVNETIKTEPESGLWKAGAVFLPNKPTGKQILTAKNLPSDYPLPFAGQTVNLADGSNFIETGYKVYDLSYQLDTNGVPYDPNWPSNSPLNPEDYYPNYFIAAAMELKNGTIMPATIKGTIPRYPTEGDGNGLGSFDQSMNNIAQTVYYKTRFILGGDEANLFPAKVTIKGPTMQPPRINSPTVAESYYNGSETIQGIYNRECFVKFGVCMPLSWAIPDILTLQGFLQYMGW